MSLTDERQKLLPPIGACVDADNDVMSRGQGQSLSGWTNDDDEVLETKEVVKIEGDRKKITYTRKTSVAANRERHCHSNVPAVPTDKKSRNKLILASILCLIFMVLEVVGGLLAGSLAIISDAAHLLTDFASFMISLLAFYLASRPATRKFNYGWHRAEILGALTSIILLWILTGVLAYEAVIRVIDTNYEIDSTIMLITAGTGVAFNLILGTTLHQHSHSHGGGHGHSHGGSGHSHGGSGHSHNSSSRSKGEYGSMASKTGDKNHFEISMDADHAAEGEQTKKGDNINVKAAFIHVIGDLLQSIGVLVAAFLIYYKPEWKIADPICTFVFSFIVVVTTISIMRDIVVVLMEGKPKDVSFADVRETLLSVDKVKDTHNLRMWSLTMDKMAISVHLVVEEGFDAHEVLKNASLALRNRFNIMDITIQIEEYVEEMDDCDECVGPS